MSSPPPRRLRRGLLVALAVLLLLAGGAVAFVLANTPGDVSHPDVEFTTDDDDHPRAATERPQAVDNFLWPTYGYTADRTRDYGAAPRLPETAVQTRLDLPQRRSLLEFPPAIDGRVAVPARRRRDAARDRRRRAAASCWRQRVGRLAAASPAVGDGRVYAVVAAAGCPARTAASPPTAPSDGKQVWSKALPSRAESSPLLRRGTRLLRQRGRHRLRAARARRAHELDLPGPSGAVKGGLAFADGNLYFGDYGGKVHAVRARDGKEVWSVGTSGTRFGFGSGSFYSTAAVAFGRVYLGNTDGRVYSFAASNGQARVGDRHRRLRLRLPRRREHAGLGPTVYIGSYDGNFYAFDARSGAKRWSYAAGKRDLRLGDDRRRRRLLLEPRHATTRTALDARTGRRLFFCSDGAFNPVVADRRAIYLAGYANLYELLPKRGDPRWRRANEIADRTARETSPEALEQPEPRRAEHAREEAASGRRPAAPGPRPRRDAP